MVTLEDTVSAGTIIISGVGLLQDNTTGIANVNTDGLMSKGTIVASVEHAIGAEVQYASFNGGVTVDTVVGVSGTLYNIGTSANPVNNLTDAVSIANTRGFGTLYVNNNMVLDNGNNLENFTIIGKSRVNTVINVHSNLVCDGLEIVHCNVSGTLDGNTIIKDCYIGDLSYVNGQIESSGLYGIITLGGSKTVVINNCNMTQHDKTPVIDMGGSGQDLLLGNFSGFITIKNLHSATEGMSIGLNAGVVTLDETITAGTIFVSGIGILEDNSTGTADINIDGLMSKGTIAETVENTIGSEIQYSSFNGGVTIDTVAGVSGTLYNIGTMLNPVNNVIDAVVIAEERGFTKIYVNGDITFGSGDNIDGFEIRGQSTVKSKFIIEDAASTENCEFFDATISGVLDGNAVLERCVVGNLNYITGRMFTCALTGTIILTGANPVRLLSCFDGTPGVVNPIIDCGGSGRGLAVGDWNGGLEIINKTGPEEVAINMSAGRVILHDTVTNGNIFVRGIGTLEDNSTGSAEVESIIVSPESISDAVWEEQISDHTTVSGSTAELMDKIKKLVNLIPVGL